ncbi:hypothetical protein [Reichenbachiella sp.]
MKASKYILLADVKILHTYYSNGIFRDLKVIPEQRSEAFIWNRGLIFRTTETGFSIYHQDDFDADYLRELIAFFGQFYLRFQLYSTNEQFTFFTNTPLDELVTFSFSNKKSLEQKATNLLVPDHQINLFEAESIGHVDLYLDEFLSEEKITPKTYTIRFEARNTQWNYYVVSPDERSSYEINDPEGSLLDGPQSAQMPNGQKAFRFSSGDQLYPIQERYEKTFSLKKKDHREDDEEVLIEKLPTASPSSITNIEKLNQAESKVAQSTMYIYL